MKKILFTLVLLLTLVSSAQSIPPAVFPEQPDGFRYEFWFGVPDVNSLAPLDDSCDYAHTLSEYRRCQIFI